MNLDYLMSKILKINSRDYSIEDYRQIKYSVMTVLFISITMFVASVTRLVIAHAVETFIAVCILNPLMVSSLFFLKNRKVQKIVSGFIVFLIILTASYAIVASGGIQSPIAFWIIGLPILFGAMIPLKSYFVWVLVVVAVILYLPFHEIFWINPDFNLFAHEIPFTRFRMLLFLVTICSILIYFYKKTIQETMGLLVEKKEQLNNLLKLVGHDLATPLNVIGGAVRQLKRDGTNPKYIGMMENSYNAMYAILNRTKDMRALDSGKVVFDIKNENLLSMCKESSDYFQKELKLKGLNINLAVDPKLEVKVDRLSFVHQVLNNLFSNAIKFSNLKSKIDVFSDHSESNRIKLIIQDYGIGIPKDLLDVLFSPGAHTTRIGTSSERGTGFGMLLVREHLQQYQADIIVESEENIGTKMILSFLSI